MLYMYILHRAYVILFLYTVRVNHVIVKPNFSLHLLSHSKQEASSGSFLDASMHHYYIAILIINPWRER